MNTEQKLGALVVHALQHHWDKVGELAREISLDMKDGVPVVKDVAKLSDEVDRLRVQLAGCSVAALGGTSEETRVPKDAWGWSPAYQDVLELRLRHDRMQAALEGDAGFLSANVESDTLSVGMKHPIVALMADGLYRAIGEHNYIEMQMTHKVTGERFVCHLQRALKPTPHELRRRAETLLKECIDRMRSESGSLDAMEAFAYDAAWERWALAVDELLGTGKTNIAFLDLVSHLYRARAFSEKTFGPGPRTAGVLDHIRKELVEIEKNPTDVSEWIDVVILALDGAWRAGHAPEAIAAALTAKQTKNEHRKWPDWRTAPEGKAIEHVRS